MVLLVKVTMQVHVGAARVDKDLVGAVVEVEGNVQVLVSNFHPLAVLSTLAHFPCGALVVVAIHPFERRTHHVGSSGEAAEFNQSHRGAANLGSRGVQNESLTLQKAETFVEEV